MFNNLIWHCVTLSYVNCELLCNVVIVGISFCHDHFILMLFCSIIKLLLSIDCVIDLP